MEEEKIKLEVRFTQQQIELLDKLKEEGIFRETYEKIALNVFRNYIKQSFGPGGA